MAVPDISRLACVVVVVIATIRGQGRELAHSERRVAWHLASTIVYDQTERVPNGTAKQQNTAYYAYSTQTRTTSLNRLAQAAWAWRRPVTTTRVDGTQCTLAAAASGRTSTQGRCRAYTVVP